MDTKNLLAVDLATHETASMPCAWRFWEWLSRELHNREHRNCACSARSSTSTWLNLLPGSRWLGHSGYAVDTARSLFFAAGFEA